VTTVNTPAPRTALITGIAGQDATYLAELLLARGVRVVGSSRDPAAAEARLPPGLQGRIGLVALDLQDPRAMVAALRAHRPAEVYNLAGFSSGTGLYDEAAAIGRINGLAVTHWLEALREAAPTTRFCQALSSELFAHGAVSPQDEDSPVCPRSPYGAAKAYAHSMVRIYRERYGLFAASAILYDHESPRRGLGFVTRKVADGAARIKLGQARELQVADLEARRDWGFAGDTARALWSILQATTPDDFVVATGETHSVEDLCRVAFEHVGLDWRNHVRVDASDRRPAEPVQLVGNAARARARLGWAPEVTFEAMVRELVDAALLRLAAGQDVGAAAIPKD
jgi:GDPmannose 4,6-dehydratase